MDGEDVEELLTAAGYGVLSLCRDGEPYSLPISFGYDGESVYFVFLQEGPDSEKATYMADGASARLLVTDIRGRFEWQSVAVTGPVRELDAGEEREHCLDTVEENGWFMRSFERADSLEELHAWELRPEGIKGLERREEVYE
jgi:nitroimidazol reductase NimA-like FMN-containing flavoprotein (pyridoxamine 5'-phosphate oxidase superfamily)